MNKNVAIVKVYHKGRSLYQKELILKNGKTITRNFEGISETLEPGEDPTNAAIRGLKEELKLKSIPLYLETYKECKISPSSGEMTNYIFYVFVLSLSMETAKDLPLVIQENKGTIVFEWR